MKQFYLLLFIIGIIACNKKAPTTNEGAVVDTEKTEITLNYTKADLQKLKWLEGKWKGTDGKGLAFYEIYTIINDSTIQITGYEWDGKDSNKTSVDYLAWNEGVYYLGKQQNYKTQLITDTSIYMIPNNNAKNDILWTKKDNGWEVLLKGPKQTLQYYMEPFDPFIK